MSRAENGVTVRVGGGVGGVVTGAVRGRGQGAGPGQVSSSSRPAEYLESKDLWLREEQGAAMTNDSRPRDGRASGPPRNTSTERPGLPSAWSGTMTLEESMTSLATLPPHSQRCRRPSRRSR